MSNNSTTIPTTPSNDPVPAHHANPVVAFIIGLAIILLSSILNAAGLNLTKLDHVRTSAVPKEARRKDYLRPLWLLGMLLYILSQLIGSTLALEYMRAEYVAPLGSTSLVFNFLFARFLVGTPVTSTDIYGTIIVVFGVIGIVAFGSINSGLAPETDAAHLTYLWRRGGWLGFFFAMTAILAIVLLCTVKLDAILAARSELEGPPLSSMVNGTPTAPAGLRSHRPLTGIWKLFARFQAMWGTAMWWLNERLEAWVAPQDDKQIAWTLGIGWACCGGGLAGGCLVFAKACVKLISGSLSHENTGNQFGQASSIFTFIFLAITAVLQIICLNRGLRVYDSTLVVPMFYGIYTASGFLDSLIFNNEVDAYKSWTLFLIFLAMIVLISGVVLLTHKKPEHNVAGIKGPPSSRSATMRSRSTHQGSAKGTDEEHGLRTAGPDGEVFWAVGDDSGDEGDGEGDDATPLREVHPRAVASGSRSRLNVSTVGQEGQGLIDGDEGREQYQDWPAVDTRPAR